MSRIAAPIMTAIGVLPRICVRLRCASITFWGDSFSVISLSSHAKDAQMPYSVLKDTRRTMSLISSRRFYSILWELCHIRRDNKRFTTTATFKNSETGWMSLRPRIAEWSHRPLGTYHYPSTPIHEFIASYCPRRGLSAVAWNLEFIHQTGPACIHMAGFESQAGVFRSSRCPPPVVRIPELPLVA